MPTANPMENLVQTKTTPEGRLGFPDWNHGTENADERFYSQSPMGEATSSNACRSDSDSAHRLIIKKQRHSRKKGSVSRMVYLCEILGERCEWMREKDRGCFTNAAQVKEDILRHWKAFQCPRCGTTFGKHNGLRRHMETTGKCKHGLVLPTQPRLSHSLEWRVGRLQAAKGIDAIKKAIKGWQSEFTYSTIDSFTDSDSSKTRDKDLFPTRDSLHDAGFHFINATTSNVVSPGVFSDWGFQDEVAPESNVMDSQRLVNSAIDSEAFINAMQHYHAYFGSLLHLISLWSIGFIFSDSKSEGGENPHDQFQLDSQGGDNPLLSYGELGHKDIYPELALTSASAPTLRTSLTDYHGMLPITRDPTTSPTDTEPASFFRIQDDATPYVSDMSVLIPALGVYDYLPGTTTDMEFVDNWNGESNA